MPKWDVGSAVLSAVCRQSLYREVFNWNNDLEGSIGKRQRKMVFTSGRGGSIWERSMNIDRIGPIINGLAPPCTPPSVKRV